MEVQPRVLTQCKPASEQIFQCDLQRQRLIVIAQAEGRAELKIIWNFAQKIMPEVKLKKQHTGYKGNQSTVAQEHHGKKYRAQGTETQEGVGQNGVCY